MGSGTKWAKLLAAKALYMKKLENLKENHRFLPTILITELIHSKFISFY